MTLFKFIKDNHKICFKLKGSTMTLVGQVLENYFDYHAIEAMCGDDPSYEEIRILYCRRIAYERYPWSNQDFRTNNMRMIYLSWLYWFAYIEEGILDLLAKDLARNNRSNPESLPIVECDYGTTEIGDFDPNAPSDFDF